jgi:hypothetical protein
MLSWQRLVRRQPHPKGSNELGWLGSRLASVFACAGGVAKRTVTVGSGGNPAISHVCLRIGGDDETRTRDPCRNRAASDESSDEQE